MTTNILPPYTDQWTDGISLNTSEVTGWLILRGTSIEETLNQMVYSGERARAKAIKFHLCGNQYGTPADIRPNIIRPYLLTCEAPSRFSGKLTAFEQPNTTAQAIAGENSPYLLTPLPFNFKRGNIVPIDSTNQREFWELNFNIPKGLIKELSKGGKLLYSDELENEPGMRTYVLLIIHRDINTPAPSAYVYWKMIGQWTLEYSVGRLRPTDIRGMA